MSGVEVEAVKGSIMNFGVLEQAIHHAAKEKLGTAKSSRSPPKPTQALDSGLWTLDAGPDSPTDQSRATRARAERRSDMTDRQTDSLQPTDPDDLHAT